MWKPGTAKPRKNDSLSDALTQPPPKTPTTGSAKKKLSGSTMGMRFMQKRNQPQTPTPKKQPENNDDGVQGMQVDEVDVDDAATNSDIYGMQSDLIGRRSFGGFKPKVDNNWQDCKRFINGEEEFEGKKQKHVPDEELLKRYQELLHGKSDHEKTSRQRKRKTKPASTNSNTTKKTKA